MKYIFLFVAVLVVGIVGWSVVGNDKAASPTETADTDVSLMQSERAIEVVSEDGLEYFPEARGFYVEPAEAGEYPGVVMIHENRGLRPEIKEAAEELAREGYRVLAVDLYKGNVLETQDEARAYSSQFEQAEGLENLQTAVAFLKDRGAEKVASLGWCFGGKQSVELSIS